MARFRFNLQPVLEQRFRVEREHQKRVALLEQERVRLEEQIAGHQRAMAAEQGDLRARLFEPGARVMLPQVRQQAAASLAIMMRAQRCAVSLAGVLKRLEAARAELIRATAARRGVEVLRERRYEAWKREQDRREAGELDEIAITRPAQSDAGHLGDGAPSLPRPMLTPGSIEAGGLAGARGVPVAGSGASVAKQNSKEPGTTIPAGVVRGSGGVGRPDRASLDWLWVHARHTGEEHV